MYLRPIVITGRRRRLTIPQRHGQYYGINNLRSRLEVTWGRWFWYQSKACIWLPSSYGPWSSISNLNPI